MNSYIIIIFLKGKAEDLGRTDDGILKFLGKMNKVSSTVTQQVFMSRPRCHLKDKKLSLCISMNCQELVKDIGGKDGQEVVPLGGESCRTMEMYGHGGGRHRQFSNSEILQMPRG